MRLTFPPRILAHLSPSNKEEEEEEEEKEQEEQEDEEEEEEKRKLEFEILCPGSFACLQMDLQRIFLSTLMVSVFIAAGGADI